MDAVKPFIAAALCLMVAPATLADQLPPPAASYAAKQALTVNGARLEAVIHHDHGKERRESRVDGLTNLLIVRPDQPRALVIQPESKVAMEIEVTDPEVGVVPTALAKLNATRAGTETLNGEKVTRYRVQDTFPQGGGFDGYVWSSSDGIYVRIQGMATDGEEPIEVSMDLTDIRRGPQPAELFTPPSGLRLMTMEPLEGRVPPAFQDDKKSQRP